MKRITKIGLWVLALIPLLAIGGFAIAVATGHAYVGLKGAPSASTQYAAVCSDETIKQFADVSNTIAKSEADIDTNNKKIIDFAETIKSKSSYREDPTCIYIAFVGSVLGKDATSAQQYVTTLNTFAKEGKYVNTSVTGLTSLTTMQSRVDALKSDSSKDPELGTG